MELIRFTADRLPGIPRGFSFAAEIGLNILTGPNGCGKSSTARALAGLLWPDREPLSGMDVRARFRMSGRELVASSTVTGVAWSEEGRVVQPPPLPASHLAACYHLDILDLISPDGNDDDRELAHLLATALTGGMDPDRLRSELFSHTGIASGRKRRELREARAKVETLRKQQEALSARQARLADMERQAGRARMARRRLAALDDLRRSRDKRHELERCRQELAAFAPGCAKVRPQDLSTFRSLQQELSEVALRQEKLEQEQEQARRRLPALTPPPACGVTAALEELDEHLTSLGTAWTEMKEARRTLDQMGSALGRTAPAGDGLPAGQDQAVTDLDAERLDRILDAWAQGLECRARIQGLRVVAERSGTRAPGGPAALLPGASGGLLGGAAIAWWLKAEPWLSLSLAGLGLILLVVTWWSTRRRAPAPETDGAGLLREAEKQLEQAENRLRETLQGTGLELDPDSPSGPLVMHRIKTHLDYLEQQGRARDVLNAARQRWEQELAACNKLLADMGHDAVTDQAGARSARTTLTERWREHQACHNHLGEMAAEIKTCLATRARLQQKTGDLLHTLQLDPQTATERDIEVLVDRQPAFQDLQQQISTLEAGLADLDLALGAAAELFPDLDLMQLSPLELEGLHEREQELAAASTDLEREIGALKQEIRAASHNHALEQALAARGRAEDALQEAWQQELICTLGERLIQDINTEYRQRTRPRALEEADRILRTITGQALRLTSRADGDSSSTFVVHDETTDLDLTPAQLSTGTRTQLFLAVRLGFLSSQTDGGHPPLILDDILTTSDPARFASAVTSLGRLAQDNRLQLLYLCARPDEVKAWQQVLVTQGLPPAHVIDLAVIRKLAAIAPPDILEAWNPDQSPGQLPPAPDGMTPDAYGRLLEVPLPRTWDPPGGLHLFYLLTEDLPLLHRLLTAGVRTVGHWRTVGEKLRESSRVTTNEYRKVEAMISLWERFLALWRVGRPPRVSPEFLRQSPAVPQPRLAAVAALLEQNNHCGAALVAALRDKAIPRFHKAKIDQLEEELLEAGLIDPRTALTPDELIRRLATAEQAQALAAPPDTQTIHLLVDRLQQTLDA